MGHAKFITSESKSGLSPEESAVLDSKIENLVKQLDEINGWRLEVKTEMALKNKFILPQQEEELFEIINSGSELYDRYNGGERTETLLKELEDYSRRVQEKKKEIWDPIEIKDKKEVVPEEKGSVDSDNASVRQQQKEKLFAQKENIESSDKYQSDKYQLARLGTEITLAKIND